MKTSWQKLSPRQQLVTVIASISVVVILWVLVISMPLQQYRMRQQAALAQAQQQVLKLQPLEQQFANSQKNQTEASAVDLLSAVNQSLQQHGLQAARMQQMGEEEVQVRLEGVLYAEVIAWLATLEQSRNIGLNRVNLTQGENATTNVMASLLLLH